MKPLNHNTKVTIIKTGTTAYVEKHMKYLDMYLLRIGNNRFKSVYPWEIRSDESC